MYQKLVPRKFQCSECARKTYSYYPVCAGCWAKGSLGQMGALEKEHELRKKIHRHVEEMSLEQLAAFEEFVIREKTLSAKNGQEENR